jgi:hypothetical protein
LWFKTSPQCLEDKLLSASIGQFYTCKTYNCYKPHCLHATIILIWFWLFCTRCILPNILCDGTRWSSAVNLIVRPTFPHKMNHRYALNKRQDLRAKMKSLDKRKFCFAITGIKPRSTRQKAIHHIKCTSSNLQ